MDGMAGAEDDGLDQLRQVLQARHEQWFEAFDRARGDSRVRHDELIASHERMVEEFERLRRDEAKRFDKIDVAIENDRRVTREMLLEIRETRVDLGDVRDGTRALIEGLLRVLDEFRRGDGPSPAGA